MKVVNLQFFGQLTIYKRLCGHFSIGNVKGKYLQIFRLAISQPLIENWRKKGTLFPSTFKVWENKVPLVFSILAQRLRYSHFLNSRMAPCWCGWWKMRKRLYLSPWSKIGKTKGTLFPSTLKVWESKVTLVFSILVQRMRYRHFLNLRMALFLYSHIVEKKLMNGYIWAPEQKLKKKSHFAFWNFKSWSK